MQTIARFSFPTVKTEGDLLPADLLQRIAERRDIEGLRPKGYHLLPCGRPDEAINRVWNRCPDTWLSFDDQRHKQFRQACAGWLGSGGDRAEGTFGVSSGRRKMWTRLN